jgi:dimethylhistidine N-methyltransferase
MPPATARFSLIETMAGRDVVSFGEEVASGLSGVPKRLPYRFLYDAAGSQLFEQICDLPEYYLTRAEREILEARADEVAGLFAGPITMAELGSGSSTKTRLLIEAFLRRHGRLRYVPVDISRSMLEASALELLESYGGLEVRAIASEYEAGLRHVSAETQRPKLIVWLGSTMGNLQHEEAIGFLKGVRQSMAPADRMLVGIDLRKDPDALEAAYDDAQGVTARFTLNLLERINRELGGHFDLRHFFHRAVYHEPAGRVAIDLVSTRAQRVAVDELELEFEFAEGEAVHVEDSFKYSAQEIGALTAAAGLGVDRSWQDAAARFSLSLLGVRDSDP